MDDSRDRFWEHLIADSVGVIVAAFCVQGLWFGLVEMLVEAFPDLEPGLGQVSSVLFEFPQALSGKGLPWLLGIAAGLGWAGLRAVKAAEPSPGRR